MINAPRDSSNGEALSLHSNSTMHEISQPFGINEHGEEGDNGGSSNPPLQPSDPCKPAQDFQSDYGSNDQKFRADSYSTKVIEVIELRVCQLYEVAEEDVTNPFRREGCTSHNYRVSILLIGGGWDGRMTKKAGWGFGTCVQN